MATLLSRATGNFTSSSTWALCDSTAELDSEVGLVSSPTTLTGGTAFTPGAITVDGMAVKLMPNGTSGTIQVQLWNNTDSAQVASVTVNMVDLNQGTRGSGWFVFPFSSVTLTAGKAYQVRIATQFSGMANIFRDATANNFARQLRTTTQQAPAANDKLLIAGELTGAGTGNSFTVTMDNTATTSFGPTVSGGPPQGMTISYRGTLDWGTTASTNYYLKIKGVLGIFGGTMNMGTSGTPVPSTSTAVLEFDSVANVDSGMMVAGGTGVFNSYGATKTTQSTLLTVDKSAAATTLTVGSTSGWAAGDELAIASTSRTTSHCEKKTILTVDSGTTVTLTAGLTNAHSGTSPTQAEVINLTNNVKIRGVSGSLQGYIALPFNTSSPVAFTSRYTEFYQLGSATGNKRGIDDLRHTSGGSLDIQNCSLHDFLVTSSIGYNVTNTSTGNILFNNNVMYNTGTAFINHVSGMITSNWQHNNNICILCTGQGITLLSLLGQASGNTIVSCGSIGFTLGVASILTGSFGDNTVHSNGNRAFSFSSFANGSIPNLTAWRNNAEGMQLQSLKNVTFPNFVGFGNNGNNGGSAVYCNGFNHRMIFTGMVSNGDTSFGQGQAISFLPGTVNTGFILEDSDLGTASGIKTAHSGGSDIRVDVAAQLTAVQLIVRNTKLASASEVAGQANMSPGSYIRAQKHDQTAGLHKAWYDGGTIDIDTTTYRTASPSERLYPISSTIKLESGPKRVAVANGNTVTPTVYVRYGTQTGTQPRLMVRKNVAAGISADTALATASYNVTRADFETGVLGNTIAVGEGSPTPWDATIFSGTRIYDNAHVMHGNLAMKINGNAIGWQSNHMGTLTDHYTTFYFWTAGTGTLGRFLSGGINGTQAFDFQISAGGLFQFADNTSTLTAGSTDLRSQWIRVEFRTVQSATVGQYILKTFAGDSTTPLDNFTGTANRNNLASIDTIRIGGAATDVWFDDIQVNTGGFTGPILPLDFVSLSGTTASVTDDAVLEFYVDGDLTSGVMHVDDWSVV